MEARGAYTERAAAHTHFLDLCKLFEHDDPVSADPTGEWFTFEKGATKTGGGEGFADVWKKNYFAWEYKKPDLNAAMDQLVRYAAALENPRRNEKTSNDQEHSIEAPNLFLRSVYPDALG